ncbi:hypothetical protein CRG98_040260 [Punica granatum]|uniref:Uncharacterized protein n=1 Tax=Punica granatum TaxID=22663 RepID=A0A2I0I5W5_PUNGR|nr:hypothetical protein CRG98_040260 [Punica granatum]
MYVVAMENPLTYTRLSKVSKGPSKNTTRGNATILNRRESPASGHYNSKQRESQQDKTGPSSVQMHLGTIEDHAFREYYTTQIAHQNYHGSKCCMRKNHSKRKLEQHSLL